jgi:hypothetical protein
MAASPAPAEFAIPDPVTTVRGVLLVVGPTGVAVAEPEALDVAATVPLLMPLDPTGLDGGVEPPVERGMVTEVESVATGVVLVLVAGQTTVVKVKISVVVTPPIV